MCPLPPPFATTKPTNDLGDPLPVLLRPLLQPFVVRLSKGQSNQYWSLAQTSTGRNLKQYWLISVTGTGHVGDSRFASPAHFLS